MEQLTIVNQLRTDSFILPPTLICFSHLRWDFVYQRPQQLLSRLANTLAVYFIEEPLYDGTYPHYTFSERGNNVTVVVPHLPEGIDDEQAINSQQQLLDALLAEQAIDNFVAWYYTPMALRFSRHLKPAITVFDCMDELSAFKFAPQALKTLEAELLSSADIVFTGGRSLYHSKKSQHHNIHCLPSSIDKAHFKLARNIVTPPDDQVAIDAPRLGFFGVIDERFDIDLIDQIALLRPDWHIVLIGPVVKIEQSQLPIRANIHYLGPKSYLELPAYLAGWDIALIPFQLNESTRFISPTKTPEYLTAGVPVISTPIEDVVEPYGDEGLVFIGANAQQFITHADVIINGPKTNVQWLSKVDEFLRENSWDNTVSQMIDGMTTTLQTKKINE